MEKKRKHLACKPQIHTEIKNIAETEETKIETITNRALKSYIDFYKINKQQEVD